MKKDIDYEFIKEDLPSLIKSCREGTERTKNIVQDLKNFSRLDANIVSTLNLPKEIDTTLNILHNKLKNSEINIHKEYIIGNHAVTLVDIPEDNIILVVDTTNPSIGIYKDGSIKMFNPGGENFIESREFGDAFFNANSL